MYAHTYNNKWLFGKPKYHNKPNFHKRRNGLSKHSQGFRQHSAFLRSSGSRRYTAVKMHRRIYSQKIDKYIHRIPRLLQHIASYHCRLFDWPLSLGTPVSLVILMALDFNWEAWTWLLETCDFFRDSTRIRVHNLLEVHGSIIAGLVFYSEWEPSKLHILHHEYPSERCWYPLFDGDYY